MPQHSQVAASPTAPIMQDEEEECADPYIPPVRPCHPEQQQQQQQQQQRLYQKTASRDVRKQYSSNRSNRRQVADNRRQRQQHELGPGPVVISPNTTAASPSTTIRSTPLNINTDRDTIYLDLEGETRLSHDALSGITTAFHLSPLHSRNNTSTSSSYNSPPATNPSLASPGRTTAAAAATTWSPFRADARDQKLWTSASHQHSTTQFTSSGSHSSPARKQQQQQDSMIMFSDPYEVGSVTTGMSQQELIRKKAREQSKQRHKSKKRKPKNKIVLLPSSLLLSSSSGSLEGTLPPKPPQYQRKDDDDSRNKHNSNSNRWRILPKKFQRHHNNNKDTSLPPEEMEHSTAETSESGGEGGLDQQNATTTKTKTLSPQHQRNDQQQQQHATDCDARSVVSEYSFPLLSREATGGMPVLHENEQNTTNNNSAVLHNITLDSSVLLPATETTTSVAQEEFLYEEADSRTTRSVRFIDGVVSEQIPWDEEKDLSYDVSAGPMSTTTTSSSSSAAAATTTFSVLEQLQEQQQQQQHSRQQQQQQEQPPRPQLHEQQEQPKSILRTSRFAPQPNRSYMQHSRNSLQQKNSPPRLKVLGRANVPPLQQQRRRRLPPEFPKTQPQAPPPPLQLSMGGPKFLDQQGVEVSPIPSEEDDDDDDKVVGMAGRQRQVIQSEDLAPNRRYADPPILQMDDESMSSSGKQAATFLETVAAIVIQTAYRRYLAIEFVQYLREELAEQELRRKRVVQNLLLANGGNRDSQQQQQQQRAALVRDSSAKVSNRNLGDQQQSSEDAQSRTRGYSNSRPNHNMNGRQQSPSDVHSTVRLASQSVRSSYKPSDQHVQPSNIPKNNLPIRSVQRSQEAFRRPESRGIANNFYSEQSQTGARSMIKKERIHEVYILSAIRIQAAFRGFWARDSLNVDHYCAGIIQRTFRKYLHMRNYLFVISRVIYIQSIWRRSIARDYAATLLGAAILIQAFVRGYLTRKALLTNSLSVSMFYPTVLAEEEARAATLIQTTYRRFACEKRYICALVDVLIVQTVVRRWLAGREVHKLRQDINNAKISAVLNQQRGIVPLSKTPSVKSYWQSRQQNR